MRIETYPLDFNITLNDFVIGTDGDSLNATKNYKVLTFLNYLGTMYNLNSTDLLYTFDNVAPNDVTDGIVSVNNYASNPILMSGVTTINISKVTTFGQLVDDILNTIGTEKLTIMFTDMADRNNLGIFTVNSTSDINANTIAMDVTATTSVGVLTAGKVFGVRIGVGGGTAGVSSFLELSDTPSSYAGKAGQSPYVNPTEDGLLFKSFLDTSTNQVFYGIKTAAHPFNIADCIIYNVDSSVTGYASGGSTGYEAASKYYFTKHTSNVRGIFDFSGISANRTYTLQDKSGTIAHLDDVPAKSGIVTTVSGARNSAGSVDELISYTFSAGTLSQGDVIIVELFINCSGESGSSFGEYINESSHTINNPTGSRTIRWRILVDDISDNTDIHSTITYFDSSDSIANFGITTNSVDMTDDFKISFRAGGTSEGAVVVNFGYIELKKAITI